MAKVLVIHGIGQQEQGPNTLHARLFPALQDGLARAGTDIAPADVTFASYGDLFRPAAEVLAPTPYYDARMSSQALSKISCWPCGNVPPTAMTTSSLPRRRCCPARRPWPAAPWPP